MRGFVLTSFAIAALAACKGQTTSVVDSDAGGGGPTPCDALPVPPHFCVGGDPVPRCNPRPDGSHRWQIDCVPRDPNAPSKPSDSWGISPCPANDCGPQPTWNDDDCLYGFVPKSEPQCESLNRGPCTWNRRCQPKPCSHEEGTCNTLDRSRLGKPCGGDVQCPEGSSCASFSVNIGEYVDPVCVPGDPCELLTCVKGTCAVLESYPAQVVCGR